MSDDEDFSAFRSPGGKEKFAAGEEPQSPKSAALAPHVKTAVEKPKDIGGGYKELTASYMESLVDAATNPAQPCQLIDATTYKQIVKTILAVSGGDQKQLVMWTLGHGNTGIKKYVKSSKAKEILAGLKLCELLMVQVGVVFAGEICGDKWSERLYGVFYDTNEPILKMTIAQHIADWLEMFTNIMDVTPLRYVAKKIAKNALSNGGYGVPKPTAMATKFAAKNAGGAKPAAKKPAASPAAADGEIDDAPVRDPRSPAPEKKPSDPIADAAMKKAEIMAQCFKRYDLDSSGTINTAEELEQLCTNLCFKLKIMAPPGAVEEKVSGMGYPEGDEAGPDLNLGEFANWFDEEFGTYKRMK